jgi:GAF domain-containing protein
MTPDFSLFNPGSLIQKMTPDMEDRGNLARTLQHLALVAQEVFVTDICVISALHPITGAALFSFQISEDGSSGELQSSEEFALEALLPELLQQDMLMVSNLNAMPGHQNDFTLSKGIQAFVALALRIRPESPPFGTLYLAFREPHTFSPDSYELLQFFAHQASFVLQETWLLHRYREVARIGQEINDELSTIEALFHKLCALTIDILDARHALLLIIRKTPGLTSDLYLMDESEIIKHTKRPPAGAYRYTLDRQEPLLIQHWSEEAALLPFQISHIPGSRPKESYIFVPLILHDIPLGVLSIQHTEPGAYTREDLAVLQVLANHTALAINNIRLYHSLTQLNETGQLFTRRIDPVYPLRTTVDRIQVATEADLVVLYPMPAFQTNTSSSLLMAGDWRQPQTSPVLFNECLKKIGSSLLARAELLFAPNITDLPISLPIQAEQELRREDIVSLVMIPLQVEKEEIGILCLLFRMHQYFDAPQKLLIQGLASYTAIAFRNAHTFDSATQRHLRELEALQTIDRELNQSLELEPVLDTILRLAFESVPAEGASVLLYNPDTHALDARFIHGSFTPAWRYPSRSSRGIVWWVLEHKQAVRIGNVHTDPVWRNRYVSTIHETTSELDVPLLDGDEVIGVLNFESSKENAFSKEDLDFLLTLAGQAILAIKKAQAYEREKRLAADRQTLFDISK